MGRTSGTILIKSNMSDIRVKLKDDQSIDGIKNVYIST